MTLRLFLSILFQSAGALIASAASFAPLSAQEIESAVRSLKANGNLHGRSEIASLVLIEPGKHSGAAVGRRAKAVVIDHSKQRSFEVAVDLEGGAVESVRPILNGQPLETFDEFVTAAETVRQNQEWQAAVRRRGITNFNDVLIAVWAGGHHRPKGVHAPRLGRALSYHMRGQTNQHGPPIEGIEALVDLHQQRVIQVIDTGVRPLPRESTDFFDPRVRGTNRPALKPLLVVQPEGPSFVLRDFNVEWDQWRFSWSFNQREGLVLHQVAYRDQDRERSILHRASISEMLVPYGSPEQTWFWRNAVDQGEYGLGHCAFELVPGQTAPAHATLFNVVACNGDGSVATLTNRVFLFEKLTDSLWSHSDGSGATIGRPSRELAIGFIATVGNYDYRYTWTFRQDGVIEFEVGMTGILLMAATKLERCAICDEEAIRPGKQRPKDDERFGTLVAKNTIGVNHQHFVNVRLDFDVDGVNNSVKEINAEFVRSRRENPTGNAWEAVQTVFGREREARRQLNPNSQRHWAVFNPNHRTALGHLPSYLLEPAGNARPIMKRSNPTRRLLGFVNHAFMVTKMNPAEMFAGGDYPNQVDSPDNLETWTANNEPIHNEDVVVWYTLGMTHIPRPEEFPVMPTARTGFRIVPKGFFDRNPALDAAE